MGARRRLDPMPLSRLSVLALAACATLAPMRAWSQSPKPLTPVLLDTDANNELDDQHAIAYMLFSGDVFDVEGISVNRTRGGGDVEMQAREAERVVTLAGLARVFPVYRGANANFAEIAPHVAEREADGQAARAPINQQSDKVRSPP